MEGFQEIFFKDLNFSKGFGISRGVSLRDPSGFPFGMLTWISAEGFSVTLTEIFQ